MIAVLLILCNMFIVDNLNSVFRISAWWLPGFTVFYIKLLRHRRLDNACVWPSAALLVPAGRRLSDVGRLVGPVLSSWIPVVGPIVRHERYIQFTG